MRGVPISAVSLSLAAAVAVPAAAGTLQGRVELFEKKGKARDVSDVVVWVEGPAVRPEPATVTVTMEKKQFAPRVVVVPVGGAVAFPNRDGILHNAFSLSGENRFDLDLYRKPESRSAKFTQPGVVRVYCNIHPQMSAFVVVRDNPFWARASADGRYSIEGVPPGTWSVKAWHERAGEVEQKVAVPETGETLVDLALDASSYKRVRHKNKFGKDYKKGRY